MSDETTSTLFHKYGGFRTVGDMVHTFYDKIMEYDELARYFLDVDMDEFMNQQTEYMCRLLQGPVSYNGHDGDLRAAHQGFRIRDKDFELLAEVLEETFEEAGFEDADIDELMERATGSDQVADQD